jgi:hypothetical protein
VRVVVHHEADALQPLEHLDPERPDGGIHSVAQLFRRSHDPVLVAAPYAGKRVLYGQVRVLAHAHDHEQLVAATVHVEVVTVVEVAVAGPDVPDRLRDLVQRVVVHRREHSRRPLSRPLRDG